MSTVIRAFIAIEMSPEIQRALDQVSAQLRAGLTDAPVRWVRAENIHLTLKFLGDVSISNLEMLQKMLAAEVSGHVPFEMSVGEIGAFPNTRRPRVLWIKVQAPQDLTTLQYGIEALTERLGYPREERPFFPHLTLGRISRGANPGDIRRVSEALETFKVGFLGATRVAAVNLYRSDLGPSGAAYTCLFSAKMAPENTKS
ncbi:MAG: RNA 2',3'-cyclic phosphodiesterase [Anaerolineales bacterium]|nr:RNA 2',3'-cyclic phosphodiesterase [Anaerolineales bacterium]